MRMNLTSELIFSQDLPRPSSFGASAILVFDRRFLAHSYLRTWLSGFPKRYAVSSGESLKDLKNFPAHVAKVIKLTEGLSPKELCFVSLGGGSIGDFTGFLASVFKRGVGLNHIPSTWLAAMDSAHGGKTALNCGSVKNQIGTFYPASKVYLVRSLLQLQPKVREHDALGEFLKMALISGHPLWSNLDSNNLNLWGHLPSVIREKMKIVSKDPLERKGLRYILNLGHTLGHVLEIDKGISHGRAVGIGLGFSTFLSHRLGFLTKREFQKIVANTHMQNFRQDFFNVKVNKMSPTKFSRLLQNDKKMGSGGKVNFVFLRGIGRPTVAPISIQEILIGLSLYR